MRNCNKKKFIKKSDAANELEASSVINFQLCHNESTVDVNAPAGFLVYTEKLIIGVTENNECAEYGPESHCNVPAEDLQQTVCAMKSKYIQLISIQIHLVSFFFDYRTIFVVVKDTKL